MYGYVLGDPVNLIDQQGLHWEYSQSTGNVAYVSDETGERYDAGVGYSGIGKGLNNPGMQNVENTGPLPIGFYSIGAPETVITEHGHLYYALPLTPWAGNQMFGRKGFYWHGAKPNETKRTSSHGCPVTNHSLRVLVNSMRDGATDSLLEVVR